MSPPIDSQDFTSYAFMKIHAETAGSATPQTPLGCMSERTFVPIPPFQSCCFPKSDYSVL